MKYYSFRKGPKDVKPSFKFGDEAVNKISGRLDSVFFNQPKDVTTREGKQVTIPANINIKLDNEQSLSISVESGMQFRATANSLLNMNKGDDVEFSTYIAKGKWKVINVANPNKKKTIKWTADGEEKTAEVNEGYTWKYTKEDYPEVEIINNKKGEFVSADDSEANEFFIEKLKEHFSGVSNPQSESGEISVEDIPF